jgi:restriction system protein
MKYPSFVEFWKQKRKPAASSDGEIVSGDADSDRTPDEAIDSAYEEIRNALADDLLDQVSNCNPTFFERLVIDLLIAMGYGGALPRAARTSEELMTAELTG